MNLPVIACDWETYYDSEYSLSKITTEEYIRSDRFEVIGVSIWMPGTPRPVWYTDGEIERKIRSIDWSQYAMLAHNNYFDGAILAWRYGCYPKMYLDSMCMAQPHYGFTSGVSLAKLMETFQVGKKGDEVVRALGKRRANFTSVELAQYGVYCCNDNIGCVDVFNKLLPITPAKELALIDEAIRCFTDPRFMLNKEVLQEHYEQVVNTKQANYIWASNILGCTEEEVKSTIMSNDKLAALLLELGVDPPTKISPTTGKQAFAFAKTDDEFLALKEHESEAVQMLVTCRLGGKSTLAETRALRLLGVASRGTLPVYLKYYAAHPGRYGGGDSLNLQNLPRKGPIKDSIEAPPQHMIVEGDLSQIEPRILSYIAGQDDVVHAFAEADAGRGPDIYCYTASGFLGRTITKAENPNERQLGKVIRIALGYGMGIDRFIVTAKGPDYKVTLTPATASAAHKWYQENSVHIAQFWKNCKTALKRLLAGESYTFGVDGCIVVKADGIHLPSGRVLRYPGLTQGENDEWGRPTYWYQNRRKWVKIHGAKLTENICQSLAGSVGNDAWLRLRHRLPIKLQVHDSLAGVVHEDQAEEAVQWMREALTAPVKWLPGLPVNCEVGYHRSYGKIVKS